MKKENPYHHVDIETGLRIRKHRMLRGVSQEKLAEGCDLTFQQIQKYETGRNRVSASRLVQIADVIGVDPKLLLGVEDKEQEKVSALTPQQVKAAAAAANMNDHQYTAWMSVAQALGKAA